MSEYRRSFVESQSHVDGKKKKKENKETEGIAPDNNICARATTSREEKKKRRIKEKYTIHVYDLREDSLLLRNREKESCRRHERKYRHFVIG